MHDFQDDIDAIAGVDSVPTILDVVCRITGMGFAAVARVTEDRWIACSVRDEIAFGLQPGDELKIETTICNEIRDHRTLVVFDDADMDPVYRNHHTPATYGLKSYISMPIILRDGRFFGTLCAIDPKPHKINNPATLGTFKLFSELIAFHLDARQQLAASQALLTAEIRNSEIREQFIAVLGHDLRNPLASIDAGLGMISRSEDTPRIRLLTGMMKTSIVRMSRLIDDVLDFARGRLGGGIQVEQSLSDLKTSMEQVVEELRSSHPDRLILSEIAVEGPITCDSSRICQMLSNLIANALFHGASDQAVIIRAGTSPMVFELSVANSGEPIPSAIAKELFKPFVRASAKPNQQGLGLGLYICSEIAKAHGGTLVATSTPEETRFTFRMPLKNSKPGSPDPITELR